LVRVRGNSVFYEPPQPRKAGQRGAPAKHGARFKLSSPTRPADRSETFQLGQQRVVLSAWHGLHLKKLPELVGLVLRVQFCVRMVRRVINARCGYSGPVRKA
jgi:hypothetical protein